MGGIATHLPPSDEIYRYMVGYFIYYMFKISEPLRLTWTFKDIAKDLLYCTPHVETVVLLSKGIIDS